MSGDGIASGPLADVSGESTRKRHGTRDPACDLGFVLCIERGVLEEQARILIESIRWFAGRFSNCPIYAYSPRVGYDISDTARDLLQSHDVVHVTDVLNTECSEYGSANRVFAAAHAEATTQHTVLCILDTDTLFLAEPASFALADGVDVLVRPVDVKGCCTVGFGDPFDKYWRHLSDLCSVPYDRIPTLVTSVDSCTVKSSYNGGLVVVRTERGILRRWEDFFLRSVRAELTPRTSGPVFRSSTGPVPALARRWWGRRSNRLRFWKV